MINKRMRTLSLTNTISLSFLIFISCSNVKESNNRTQRVADLPYRSLSVSDSLRAEIEHEVYRIVSKLSSEDLKLLYRKTNKRRWQECAGKWEDVQGLRQSALDAWGSEDIECTMIVFPTTNTDPILSKVTKLIGVEYEHTSLTGTCVIMIDKTEGRPVYFDYFERK